jgi:hypothetical protein
MPAIASTGAMLSSGHQRHQLEVGLSLPNLIQTSLTRLGALGQVFGTSDPDEAARSTALIDHSERGRQFDPEIVKVFLEMPDKIWKDLRRDVERSARRPEEASQ